MRVADYIMSFISETMKTDTVFMVSGGGIMHLMDALKSNNKLKYICSHNEQATTMQADGYAKASGKPGVALVTSGPGATNAITGVVGAWQDSTPMMVISGQSKRVQTIYNSGLSGLRQFGSQEVNILPIIESVTKYSVMINEPIKIRYYLEKAFYMMNNGRLGPVWIDVPSDVQGAIIDETKLVGFIPTEIEEISQYDEITVDKRINEYIELLRNSSRPVILAGNGVNISGASKKFNELVGLLQVPVVTPRLGIDLMDNENICSIGRIGVKGDRAGNLALQNSDLVLAIGTRLCINATGYDYENFAREAKIIVVDIDEIEHKKNTVRIDTLINCDALIFINKMLERMINTSPVNYDNWINKCNLWKRKYKVTLEEYAKVEKPINTYYFIDILSEQLRENDVVIIDSGSSSYVTSQAIKIKYGQRFFASGGLGAMGYAVPSAIGASVALSKGRIIVVTGDGSFHMNIQELQTITHNKLPIKIFVFNNEGYSSIKTTQHNYFEDRYIGVDKESGVSLPDILEISKVYGINGFRVDKTSDINRAIKETLESDGAAVCDVICSKEQQIIPTVYSIKKEDGSMVSRPLEDMYPFLERKEFFDEMIVKPVEDSL